MKYALMVYSDQSAWLGLAEEEALAAREASMPKRIALFIRVLGDFELAAAGESVYGVQVLRSTLEDVYLDAVGGQGS